MKEEFFLFLFFIDDLSYQFYTRISIRYLESDMKYIISELNSFLSIYLIKWNPSNIDRPHTESSLKKSK